ncbi:MAG: GTP cyclohydrolase FolE2 [Chloroflexota bacterium]|nr:GTP cyclohydrolase FolE2 [Chloroflexota bacterium]
MADKVSRDKLPDIQNTQDTRGKFISRAGVMNVNIPLKIAQKNSAIAQSVQANVSMYVSVAKEAKGANMSRFLETLMARESETLTSQGLEQIIEDMLNRLESKDGYISINFKYFMERLAPVSRSKGMQGYDIAFIGKKVNDVYTFVMEINVMGTNLCPCSKEISKYGAHNQRNTVRIRIVPTKDFYWIEDIVAAVEGEMSSPIYPLLKREDEKFVTETAYENPKFVEDLARDVALMLDSKNVEHYHIRSIAEESIHFHNATATISKSWVLE